MFLILVADDAECSCLSPGLRLADCVIRKTELTLGFGRLSPTEHLLNFVLQEEREHSASLLVHLRQSLTFDANG